MTERSDVSSQAPKRKADEEGAAGGEEAAGSSSVKKTLTSATVAGTNPTTDTAHGHRLQQQQEVLVDGPFNGCTVERSDDMNPPESSVIISLDTTSQLDAQRWQVVMPSMEERQFQFLERLALVNSRYIQHLHESISTLAHLRELCLVNCTGLAEITPAISELRNLKVVRHTWIGLAGWFQTRPANSFAYAILSCSHLF
jgi:hypothetical protein